MRQFVAMCALILLVPAFSVGFGESRRVYTNKDLDRYSVKKSQEAPVKYVGRKVTLDFKDASLEGVLSVLADIARQDGYLVTVEKGIQEKITLKMGGVAWDEVLDFLVESHGLVKVMRGKAIMIFPPK